MFSDGTAQSKEQVSGARFLDRLHWWVTSATPASLGNRTDHHVLVTVDGGRTWTSARPSPRIIDLVLGSPSVGWASYQEWMSGLVCLARTTDRGATWSAVAVPPAVR